MATNGTSALSIAAFALAVLGSLLGVTSLTWQMATFKLSGSRVKVRLKVAALGRGGALTAPVRPGWEVTLRQYASQGYPTPCLAIEASNVGRLGVDVVRCNARFSNGMSFDPLGHPANPPSNSRLDHGQTKTWFIELAPLQAAIDASAAVGLANSAGPQTVSVSVELGTGRTVAAKGTVTLLPRA